MLRGSTAPARDFILAMFETDYERRAFIEATEHKVRQGTMNGKLG
jgi:hypothetical protein